MRISSSTAWQCITIFSTVIRAQFDAGTFTNPPAYDTDEVISSSSPVYAQGSVIEIRYQLYDSFPDGTHDLLLFRDEEISTTRAGVATIASSLPGKGARTYTWTVSAISPAASGDYYHVDVFPSNPDAPTNDIILSGYFNISLNGDSSPGSLSASASSSSFPAPSAFASSSALFPSSTSASEFTYPSYSAYPSAPASGDDNFDDGTVNNSGLTAGEIAGIAVSGVSFILILIGVTILLCVRSRRSKRQQQQTFQAPSQYGGAGPQMQQSQYYQQQPAQGGYYPQQPQQETYVPQDYSGQSPPPPQSGQQGYSYPSAGYAQNTGGQPPQYYTPPPQQPPQQGYGFSPYSEQQGVLPKEGQPTHSVSATGSTSPSQPQQNFAPSGQPMQGQTYSEMPMGGGH